MNTTLELVDNDAWQQRMHMMTDYFGPDMRVCVWMKYVSRYVKIILMYETVSMRLC